ncbi:MAG: SDR family NAD(P)-dependent oxidoreductase [Chitinivibrionales bacterium]|nr:SDR family NAD(P)-dependent oxidoreductase [Chitinivibrionales bacterium]
MDRPHIAITGVSSGIGYDTCIKAARAGFHVFGSVRNEKDAQQLIDELGDTFTPLIFDVKDTAAVAEAAHVVRNRLNGQCLRGLVNNAGFSVNGPLLHMPVQDLVEQFEVNVFGLYRVAQAFLPLLGAAKPIGTQPGRLVTISSTSGRLAYPFIGAYAASKHAVEAISDTFRRELAIYGIKVIVIQPGIVNTSIWDKRQKESPYADTDYGQYHIAWFNASENIKQSGLPVEKVSRMVLHALRCRNPRTRYVLLPGGIRTLIKKWYLPRLLPDTWLDKRLRNKWGLR